MFIGYTLVCSRCALMINASGKAYA